MFTINTEIYYYLSSNKYFNCLIPHGTDNYSKLFINQSKNDFINTIYKEISLLDYDINMKMKK